MRRFIRWLSIRWPRKEHLHEGCPGWDHDDADYCCTYCQCCPCYSWRCGVCLWEYHLGRLTDWAWDE